MKGSHCVRLGAPTPGLACFDGGDLGAAPANPVERWRNQVAAEVLAPLGSLRGALSPDVAVADQPEPLARTFKVSTLEGQTLHRDAFQMLGIKKLPTFEELAGRLGAG